tara:strand:+ start:612 stop:983 length:372 start_codon:yes stop_codon:yes gene_type:complete
MYEIALTKGRHEIISAISGEEVQDAFFGNTVENVLDVKSHMEAITAKLRSIEDRDIIVYVTGLTPLFHAVFAAWLQLRCSGYANASLDMPVGNLTFAHFNRETGQYHLINALDGDDGVELDWY